MEIKKVNTQDSRIDWHAKTVAVSQSGQIKLKDGFFEFEDKTLKGGEFIMDMMSIHSNLSGRKKKKLEQHLHSDDFFNTQNHPTATMKIKEAVKDNDLYHVVGDMEIKGKSNPVKFDLKLDQNSASTVFTVDRTAHDIRYASKKFFGNLGENILDDYFELTVDLKL